MQIFSEKALTLLADLPEIARLIIKKTANNRNFYINPDDSNEHAPIYHQFGIITHTKVFIEKLLEANKYLKNWGVYDDFYSYLDNELDGKKKYELLQYAMVLHDIGKFDRVFSIKFKKLTPDYIGHEEKGAKIILQNIKVNNLLKQKYELTQKHIEYIAECVRLHFALGNLRNEAKKTQEGYTFCYAKSDKCIQDCTEIILKYQNFKFEVGILFLLDSLAKTDIRIKADNDVEIQNQKEKILDILKHKKLSEMLFKAIMQQPINIQVAHTYFKVLITNN